MKIKMILIFICVAFDETVNAQPVYISRAAFVSFYSQAPIQDILASSVQAVSIINFRNDSIYFKIPIKTFQFERSLMQKHFNTEYLESDKYPFAEFKGKLLNFEWPAKDRVYNITVSGQMTIHGVSKIYEEQGTLELEGEKVKTSSSFSIRLADHAVRIPKLMFREITESVSVNVNANYIILKSK